MHTPWSLSLSLLVRFVPEGPLLQDLRQPCHTRRGRRGEEAAAVMQGAKGGRWVQGGAKGGRWVQDRVQGVGFRVSGAGCRVQGFGCKYVGASVWVQGVWGCGLAMRV